MAVTSQQARRTLSPRASFWFALIVTLLLAALSGLVMHPAARHLQSLENGLPARATLESIPSCMTGGCRISFEAEGRTVVTKLPFGSSSRIKVGDRIDIRYRAEDPRVVARAGDVGGGGPALFAVLSGASAVLFALATVWSAFLLWRQRRQRAA
ncbi:DUF3592 domain-containing protein [Streptomyces sp. NPDC002057]|uniref:DUF3592 domain-containing protein n=1 Tax=Streptomyces sp. NPDC002057 TaxID=3154664 RepID=UPI0033342608